MSDDCPFCNIDPEISRVVYQDELVVAMLSNPRLVPGHLLVMPRRHVVQPWQIEPEELLWVYRKVLMYQQIIFNTIAPGCDVRQNYRPFIPQGRLKVDHVHWHLLPRWKKEHDELYHRVMVHEADVFTDLTPEDRSKYTDAYEI
jgi:histidine triad (HIT) family protein